MNFKALLAPILAITLAIQAGCAVQNSIVRFAESPIKVAFSPGIDAEALVVKVIASAGRTIRLAGYSFTSPAVVRALIAAKRHGVDVKVLIDDKGNRSAASQAAMNLVIGAGIPLRVISVYAIHHDKYIIVDDRSTETGSFNYSQAAARANSENVLVVWDNPEVAAKYNAHWNSRWARGIDVEMNH